MGQLESLVAKAKEFQQNPSTSHLKLKKVLFYEINNFSFKEYAILENDGSYKLVNFYDESNSLAIEFSNHGNDSVFGSTRIIKIGQDVFDNPNLLEELQYKVNHAENIEGNKSDQIDANDLNIISNNLQSAGIPQNEESESISDIIGHPPSWLLRSGITVLAIVTTIILGMSHMIQYPDKIQSNGYITSEFPPISVVSQSHLIIDKMYVANGESVDKGDDIILFRSSAIREDIDSLSIWITRDRKAKFNPLSSTLTLGSLQKDYSQLLLLLNEYSEIVKHKSSYEQIQTIESELQNITELNDAIELENQHYQNEQKLAIKSIERSQLLYTDGLLSKVDLEEAQRRYEEFVRQTHTIAKAKVQNDIKTQQLKLEALQIAEKRSADLRNHYFKINQIITTLSDQIIQWKQKYLLKADIDGSVQIAENMSPNQTLLSGEHIMYIIPLQSTNTKIIKSKLPISGSGKVRKGVKCVVKIDAYPYKEYGVLVSRINQIAEIPSIINTQKFYDIVLDLPSELITENSDTIPFRPNMTVSLDIITNDRSILERITDQITNAMR